MDPIDKEKKRSSRWRSGFLILIGGMLLASVVSATVKTFRQKDVTEQLPQEPWVLPDEIIRKVDSVGMLMDSILIVLDRPL